MHSGGRLIEGDESHVQCLDGTLRWVGMYIRLCALIYLRMCVCARAVFVGGGLRGDPQKTDPLTMNLSSQQFRCDLSKWSEKNYQKKTNRTT